MAHSTKICKGVEQEINDLLDVMYKYQKKNIVVRECIGNTTAFISIFKTLFPYLSIKAITCIVMSDFHKGIPTRKEFIENDAVAIITHMMVEITDGEKIIRIDPSWEVHRDGDATYFNSWKVFCDNMKYYGRYEMNKEFFENELLENFVVICKSAKEANSFKTDKYNHKLLFGVDGEKMCKDQVELMAKSLEKKYGSYRKNKKGFKKLYL